MENLGPFHIQEEGWDKGNLKILWFAYFKVQQHPLKMAQLPRPPKLRELKYQVADMHVALNFQKDVCMQAQTLPRSQLREKAARREGSRGPTIHASPRCGASTSP